MAAGDGRVTFQGEMELSEDILKLNILIILKLVMHIFSNLQKELKKEN